jgi:hypothetical protein
LLEFGRAQSFAILFGDCQGAGNYFNFATLAAAAAATGEFNTKPEEKVLEKPSTFDLNNLAQRQQLDLDKLLQKLSPDSVVLGGPIHRHHGLKESRTDLRENGIAGGQEGAIRRRRAQKRKNRSRVCGVAGECEHYVLARNADLCEARLGWRRRRSLPGYTEV